MTRKKLIFAIFALALVLRIGYVLSVDQPPLVNDAKDYDDLGVRLSQGKGYADSSGSPTAYRPPIYPLLLGSIYYIAGHSLIWTRLIQALLGAGICVLIYYLACHAFDAKTAALASMICALYPPLVLNVSEIMTEHLFTFFFLWMVLSLFRVEKPVDFAISGALLGVALLTRPFLLISLPFIGLWILWKRGPSGDRLKSILIMLSASILVLAPWTVRNYYQLKSFVPLANVGGLTLYNSYVIIPKKGLSFNSTETLGPEYFNISSESERSRYLIGKTFGYIIDNPWKLPKLSLAKVALLVYPFDGYWYPISLQSKYNIFWGIVLCFCIPGVYYGRFRFEYGTDLIYLLMVSFVVGAVIFYGSPRFRLPLDPLLILLAAGGALTLLDKNRWAVAALLAVNVILFFFFRYFEFEAIFNALKLW